MHDDEISSTFKSLVIGSDLSGGRDPRLKQKLMPTINEQEMRSYLLGGLPSERQAELEALAQADEDLREELLALEEELVEQYLAGTLTEDEKRSFEAHVLTTERGQRQLHFAQLFETYRNNNSAVAPLAVHRVPAPTNPPIPTSSPLFATFYRNPTFAVLSIVVVGLLITLVGWMMIKPSPGTGVAGLALGKEVVVTLAPDSTRSGDVNHMPAPAKNVQIKLELELTKSDFTKYKIKLFRANQPIDTQEELKTETRDTHYFVPVVVTAEKLTPGEYHLKLCGVADSGQPATVDNYSFRVTDADVQADQRERLVR